MDLEQVRSLIEVAEHPALAEATEWFVQGRSGLEIRARLEQTFETSTCLAVMDCVSCRLRYANKFWQPERWLLSREPAEQATDSRIARWRAEALGQLGLTELTELGCGLGGDTVFLSEHFRVKALERSPARSELARYNLSQLGSGDAVVESRSVDCSSLRGELLFVDPARRDGVRISNPGEWQPPLADVASSFGEGRFRAVAVKCAPGLKEADLPDQPATIAFVSVEGQLKEAFLLLQGDLERKRLAVLFEKGSAQPLTLTGRGEAIDVGVPQIGSYLHNPDPAILRAGALDSLAERLKASIVHPKIGYLTSDGPCDDGCANSFLIADRFPLNWKILKRKLLQTGWTEYEYLGRGVPFSQPDVRKKLGRLKRPKDRASVRGSVIMYRTDTDYTVVLGTRVPGDSPHLRGK